MIENTVVASLLAVVALGATYFYRSKPALCHMLWVIVLVRLVMPPVSIPGWPPLELKSAVQSAIRYVVPLTSRGPHALPPSVSPGPASAMIESGLDTDLDAKYEVSIELAERTADERAIESARLDPWGWESAQLDAEPEIELAIERDERAISEESIAMATGVAPSDRGFVSWWFAIWGLGSIGILGVWVCRVFRFRAALSRTQSPPRKLELAVGAAACELGVKAPRVVLHGLTGSPSLWCLGRPLLLWPRSMADAPEQTLRPVIMHELSHLRRRDHWVAWLDMAATIVMWWHPLVWVARRQLRRQAELACDARVVAAMPGQRRHYAESLITAAAGSMVRQPPAALAAVDSDRRSFEQRVRLIMQGRMSDHLSRATIVALVSATLVVAPTWAGSVGSWWFAPTEIAPALRAAAAAEITSVQADRYYHHKTWDKTVQAYAKVVAYNPANGLAHHRLGMALLAIGTPGEALNAFDNQIKSRHETTEAHALRTHTLAALGRTDEAAAALREALMHGFVGIDRVRNDPVLSPLIPTHPDISAVTQDMDLASQLRARADDDMAHARWTMARASLASAAIISPYDGQLQEKRAKAAVMAEAFDEAEVAWLLQEKLGHEPAQAVFNVARLRSHRGQIDTALDALNRAVTLGFNDMERMAGDAWLEAVRASDHYAPIARRASEPQRLRDLVERAIQSESYEAAAAAADRLLALADTLTDHQRGVAHHQRGIALLGLGIADDAVDDFVKQIELGFWVTEGLYRIACCRSAQGRSAEALLYLNAAAEAGMFGDDRLRTAPMLTNIGSPERLNKVLSLADDNRTLLGQFNAADWTHLKEISTRTIAQDPTNGPAHLGLGWALLRLGEYETAINVFKAQNRLGHLPAIAQYNVACAYALMNDRPTAIKWLKAARIAGWSDFQFALRDPDLANLRKDPEFQRLCRGSSE